MKIILWTELQHKSHRKGKIWNVITLNKEYRKNILSAMERIEFIITDYMN